MFDFLKSEAFKKEAVSVANTAVSTFVVSLASGLASGDIQWTGAFWLTLLVSAGRAVWKALVSRYIPVSLGGKKA